MKKIALLLALAFALSSFAALAGAEAQIDNPTIAFVGRWQDPVYGRASLRILRTFVEDAPEDELYYDIQIIWGDSWNSAGVWQMTARWDAEAAMLTYADGVMSIVTTDDDGPGTEEVQWDDAEGAFWLDVDGTLRWEDSREDRSVEFRMSRVIAEAPSAEAFVEDYFRRIANLERGTAGSSLKQAAAVRDVVRFAANNDLWNTDIAVMRGNMLAAWESLDDDTRARFDENFLDVVVDLAGQAFGDYASVQGLFEDAGAGEDMAYLSQDADASLSWETLFSNTFTLGNSEE